MAFLDHKEAAKLAIAKGSIELARDEKLTLDKLELLDGSLFIAGEFHAPNLAEVTGTLWLETTGEIHIPVATLEAMGNAGRLEFGIIGY